MQQHSQIVELKDRLLQALDEEYNVKNVKEVSRIISILDKTHVTREDLERTRLGKFINELRRKTTDKELAKRAKKLIKTWRDLTVTPNPASVNGHSNSSTPNAALTSPFNVHSVISPQSLSSDSNLVGYPANSYAPNAVAAVNGNGSHPALLRIRNQLITSPHEKSKPSVSPGLPSTGSKALNGTSFRAHSKTASPRDSSSQQHRSDSNSQLAPVTNGHLRASSHRSHSNLTSPVNSNSLVVPNQLSPGLRNSFKNILGRDGISPTANRLQPRTTPPKPRSTLLTSTKPDSAPSSRLSSPLSFTFNDSRDSTSSQQHHRNAYSTKDDFSTLDVNDDDNSNSSSAVFSGLTNGSRRNGSRKRKVDAAESESIQKKVLNKADVKHFASLSASSSPHFSRNGFDPSGKRVKLSLNGVHPTNGFHPQDEDSVSDFESAIIRNKNHHSLPASPALLSTRNYSRSPQSYDNDEEEYKKSYRPKVTIKLDRASVVSSPDNSVSVAVDWAKSKNRTYQTTADRAIMQVYAKLPPINPEDIEFMKQFKFDDDEPNVDEQTDEQTEALVEQGQQIPKDEQSQLDDDEYEVFEYQQEYEEEENEEVEVETDEEVIDEDDHEMSCDYPPSMNEVTEDTKEDNLSRSSTDTCVQPKPQLESLELSGAHRTELSIGDILKCDKPTTAEHDLLDSAAPQKEDNLQSVSTTSESIRPDSTVFCDDSNDAIPSSTTAAPKLEADSTTLITCEDQNVSSEVTPSTNGDNSNVPSVVSVVSSDTNKCEPIYTEEDYRQDIALLNYSPPSTPLLNNSPVIKVEPTVTSDKSGQADSVPMDVSMGDDVADASPVDTTTADEEAKTLATPPTPPPSNQQQEQSTESAESATQAETVELQPTPSDDHNQVTQVQHRPNTRRRTKLVIRPVLKKKYRKCVIRSRVKRSLVDRVAHEHWDKVNGTFDKDGEWCEFDQMTTATRNIGRDPDDPDNVVHILPYVNCCW